MKVQSLSVCVPGLSEQSYKLILNYQKWGSGTMNTETTNNREGVVKGLPGYLLALLTGQGYHIGRFAESVF